MSCLSPSSLCILHPKTLVQKEKKKSPDEPASLRDVSVIIKSATKSGLLISIWSPFSPCFISLRLSKHVIYRFLLCILDVLVALMIVMPAFLRFVLYLSPHKRPLRPNTPLFLPCMLSCLILLLCLHLIELVSLTTAVLPLVFFFFTVSLVDVYVASIVRIRRASAPSQHTFLLTASS